MTRLALPAGDQALKHPSWMPEPQAGGGEMPEAMNWLGDDGNRRVLATDDRVTVEDHLTRPSVGFPPASLPQLAVARFAGGGLVLVAVAVNGHPVGCRVPVTLFLRRRRLVMELGRVQLRPSPRVLHDDPRRPCSSLFTV